MLDPFQNMTLAEYQEYIASHKRTKYGNKPTEIDGIRFDSKAEAARYGELKLLERAGEISELKVHPKFILLYALDDMPQETYAADFQYIENGRTVIEDVKGGRATQTKLFRLKWHLMRRKYPCWDFRVVER